MNSGVSSCENCISNDVTITSSLRSVVQVLMGHFTIFFRHTDCHAKNYQKFSKFVKVTARILSIHFWGHGVGPYIKYFLNSSTSHPYNDHIY